MFAPSHWMMDKLRECMPLVVLLRNRLKYALTYRECKMIVMQRLIKVDGKVRTDMFYPAGFMDMVQIEKTKENFRLLFDTKGRFVPHKVSKEEATYKLCRVKSVKNGPKGVPYAVTHDGRTIRYPDPDVKVNDTIRLDLESGKAVDYAKFELANVCVIGKGTKPWISLPKGNGIKLSIIEDRQQ